MRLSRLQVYILRHCVLSRKVLVSRAEFAEFYQKESHPPAYSERQNIITKSIERLIQKGILVGYGRRTSEKWFIESVRLTASGRRTAKRLLGEQQQLPLEMKKKTNTQDSNNQ